MERPAYYNIIEHDFNPSRRLEWNEEALYRLAETARLEGHIRITEAQDKNYHPNREKRLLSPSELRRSDAILGKVFPDTSPSLQLPAATSFFDPESGLSTIFLNHEVIGREARIANPKNPDQGYISLLDDLTYRALRDIIRQEKMQAIGGILSKSLSESGRLAFNLSVNAAGCASVLYGGYRFVDGVIGNPNRSLEERVASGFFAGGLFLVSAAVETAIFVFTTPSVKTSYQTLRGYGKELSDNLIASLAAANELYLKRPYLVRWKS